MFRILVFTLMVMFAGPLCAVENANEVQVHKAVPWAKTAAKTLTMDIYTPQNGRSRLPVVVMVHGGGWLINDNHIMDSAARYLAEHGDFVVANLNYRLLGDNHNRTTMNKIVEDVFGGVLWVKEHIADYGGDPTEVAVTGDSAGGHLSAMVLTAGRRLSSEGFRSEPRGFKPTYLPSGKTAEEVAAEDGLAVQAAALSYGAFDLYSEAQHGYETPDNIFWKLGGATPRGIFGNDITAQAHPDYYRAVSPLYLIPARSDYRLAPTLAFVGSEDKTTPPAAVKQFVDKMRAAGQPITFKIYQGKNHAFLDSGCNEFLGNCFGRDAPDTLDDMIAFFNQHLR
ncbi:alpha/beta hydrolase [Microbulbifer hainanensis]|uniref:alpha/beta hydrolase n=1 Tax=Microbulbifer hainanensis TaxID=2735675 RepID=UPI001866F601|nr:alpha/beta hydrolase [Microbulbifer hainanensis]